MQTFGKLCAALSLLILANPLPAQQRKVLFNAVITQPEADVLSTRGVGQQSYITNKLHKGDVVQVMDNYEEGWLGIMPPEGSFSWINAAYVKQHFPQYPYRLVVEATGHLEVAVIIGSSVTPDRRGNCVGGTVKVGAQVLHLGRADLKDQDGTWLAIEAPYTETRYIRADMVKKLDPGQVVPGMLASGQPVGTGPKGGSVFTAASPGTGGALPPVVPGAIAPPPPLSEAEQIYQRALQAERTGRINDAILLYSQLATQTTGPNQDLAMQGLNRAYWLRQAQNNPSQPQVPALGRTVPATTASEVRYGNSTPDGRLVSQVGLASSPPRVRLTAPGQPEIPGIANAAPLQPATPGGYFSSGPGRLRRAGRFLENRKTYVLESLKNCPMLYVTPQEGVDLEPYVDRYVELFGPAIYHGDLRANYMTVVQVQLMPGLQ